MAAFRQKKVKIHRHRNKCPDKCEDALNELLAQDWEIITQYPCEGLIFTVLVKYE